MDTEKHTYLITGASGGVGRHLADYFAAERAKLVILSGRREDLLKQTADRVAQAGAACRYYVADLCDLASLEAMVRDISERSERIDVLINNAADVTSKPFLETSLDEMDRIIRTNVTGTLHLIRLIVPGMITDGGGVIVNISSLAGYKPNPGQTVYSISKAGVNAISEALRAELAINGIHVLNVALGSVNRGDEPGGGGVSPERLAYLLDQAIQKRKPELFISPVSKWLMRVYKTFPALARWY